VIGKWSTAGENGKRKGYRDTRNKVGGENMHSVEMK